MSEHELTPALFPEEWAQANELLNGGPRTFGERMLEWATGEVSPLPSNDPRHAVAALALYDQPFGFTREDVKMIRDIARDVGHGRLGDVKKTRANALTALAARIDALLPPEG